MIKFYLNILRGIALFWALVSLSVVALWAFFPETVRSIDDWIVAHYVKSPQEKLAQCRTLIQKNNDNAEECIESLLTEKLSNIRKEDRFARLKRDAFKEAVVFFNKKRNLDKATFWLDEWIHFDERDLTAKVSKAQIYFSYPGKRTESLDSLSSLNDKYPDVEMVTKAYRDALRFSKNINQ